MGQPGTAPEAALTARRTRRGWRFSLRMLLLFVTLAAIFFAWLTATLRTANCNRQAYLVLSQQKKAAMELSDEYVMPSWLRWLTGDDTRYVTAITFRSQQHLLHLGELHDRLPEIEKLRMLCKQAESEDAQQRDYVRRIVQERIGKIVADQGIATTDIDEEGPQRVGKLLEACEAHVKNAIADLQYTNEAVAVIDGLARLTSLNMNGMDIDDGPLGYLDGCQRLESIDLSYTNVTDAGVSPLVRRHGRHIRSLQLFGTETGDASLEGLKEGQQLRLLWTGSRVTDAGLAYLRGHTKLKELNIAETDITNEGLRNISHLRALLMLALSKTRISDDGLAHLSDLVSMSELGLAQTKVTDAGMSHLKRMSKLSNISLCTTEVTEAGIAKLPYNEAELWVAVTIPFFSESARERLNKSRPNMFLLAQPWYGPAAEIETPLAEATITLVALRRDADGTQRLHLHDSGPRGSSGRDIFLAARSGVADPYFFNLFVLESLDDTPCLQSRVPRENDIARSLAMIFRCVLLGVPSDLLRKSGEGDKLREWLQSHRPGDSVEGLLLVSELWQEMVLRDDF